MTVKDAETLKITDEREWCDTRCDLMRWSSSEV